MKSRWPFVWAFCLGLALPLTVARGVVIKGGDGQGNTNAPTDDPGWNNVGSADGYATAVYLGDNWVLTANHVGMRNLILQGTTYTYVAGSSVQLTNSGGGGADLLMYRLTTAPSLPDLTVSSNALSIGSAVTMIGRGNTRNVSSNRWYIDINVDPWIWSNKNFSAADGYLEGFYATNGNRQMRWGQNTVAGSANVGGMPSLYTVFDASAGSSEAQGTYGDSGGAVFHKNGSLWELSGIIFSVGLWSNQPEQSATAVYGDSTYFADLSNYRSQILGYVSVPEPGAGMLLASIAAVFGLLKSLANQRRS